MIIMHAMVMEMLSNVYGMIIWLCCCSFIWIPVVVRWWAMVTRYGLSCYVWGHYEYIKGRQLKVYIVKEDIVEVLVEHTVQLVVMLVVHILELVVHMVHIVDMVKVHMVHIVERGYSSGGAYTRSEGSYDRKESGRKSGHYKKCCGGK